MERIRRRRVEAAMLAKGIRWKALEYGWAPTPGEVVGGWTVELEDEVAERLVGMGHDADPDCLTLADVMEWLDDLPDLREAA